MAAGDKRIGVTADLNAEPLEKGAARVIFSLDRVMRKVGDVTQRLVEYNGKIAAASAKISAAAGEPRKFRGSGQGAPYQRAASDALGEERRRDAAERQRIREEQKSLLERERALRERDAQFKRMIVAARRVNQSEAAYIRETQRLSIERVRNLTSLAGFGNISPGIARLSSAEAAIIPSQYAARRAAVYASSQSRPMGGLVAAERAVAARSGVYNTFAGISAAASASDRALFIRHQEQSTAALQKGTAAAREHAEQIGRTRNSYGLLGGSVGEVAATIGRLTVAFIAFRALRLFTEIPRQIIEVNSVIEQAKLGIAEVISVGQRFVGAQSGVAVTALQQIQLTAGIAQDAIDGMIQRAVQFGLPLRDMVQLFTIVAGVSTRMGVGLQDQLNLTTAIGTLAQRMQLPFVQVARSIDNIFTGFRVGTNQLGVILGLTDSMVKGWKTQGTLVQELTKRTEGLNAALHLNRNLYQGIVAALGNIRDVFFLKLGEGGFEVYKRFLNEMAAGLEKISSSAENMRQVAAAGRSAAEGIVTTLRSLVNLTKFIIEHKDALSLLASVLAGGRFGGVPGAVAGAAFASGFVPSSLVVPGAAVGLAARHILRPDSGVMKFATKAGLNLTTGEAATAGVASILAGRGLIAVGGALRVAAAALGPWALLTAAVIGAAKAADVGARHFTGLAEGERRIAESFSRQAGALTGTIIPKRIGKLTAQFGNLSDEKRIEEFIRIQTLITAAKGIPDLTVDEIEKIKTSQLALNEIRGLIVSGQNLSTEDIEKALGAFRKIRELIGTVEGMVIDARASSAERAFREHPTPATAAAVRRSRHIQGVESARARARQFRDELADPEIGGRLSAQEKAKLTRQFFFEEGILKQRQGSEIDADINAVLNKPAKAGRAPHEVDKLARDQRIQDAVQRIYGITLHGERREDRAASAAIQMQSRQASTAAEQQLGLFNARRALGGHESPREQVELLRQQFALEQNILRTSLANTDARRKQLETRVSEISTLPQSEAREDELLKLNTEINDAMQDRVDLQNQMEIAQIRQIAAVRELRSVYIDIGGAISDSVLNANKLGDVAGLFTRRITRQLTEVGLQRVFGGLGINLGGGGATSGGGINVGGLIQQGGQIKSIIGMLGGSAGGATAGASGAALASAPATEGGLLGGALSGPSTSAGVIGGGAGTSGGAAGGIGAGGAALGIAAIIVAVINGIAAADTAAREEIKKRNRALKSISDQQVQFAATKGFYDSLGLPKALTGIFEKLSKKSPILEGFSSGGITHIPGLFQAPTAGAQQRFGLEYLFSQIGIPLVRGAPHGVDIFTGQFGLPSQPGFGGTSTTRANPAIAARLLGAGGAFALGAGSALPGSNLAINTARAIGNAAAALGLSGEDAAVFGRRLTAGTAESFDKGAVRILGKGRRRGLGGSALAGPIGALLGAFNDLPFAIDESRLALLAFGKDGSTSLEGLKRLAGDTKSFFEKGIPDALSAAIDTGNIANSATKLAETFSETFVSRLSERLLQESSIGGKMTEAVGLATQAAEALARGDKRGFATLAARSQQLFFAGRQDFLGTIGAILPSIQGFESGLGLIPGSGLINQTGAGVNVDSTLIGAMQEMSASIRGRQPSQIILMMPDGEVLARHVTNAQKRNQVGVSTPNPMVGVRS